MALTALLVEDDDNWRRLGKQALLAAGFDEVKTARDASDALSSIWGEPDMIFSDLHMGGSDGDEVLKMLIEHDLKIPFVVASGTLANDAKIVIAENIPSASFISKEHYLNPESSKKSDRGNILRS